MRGNQLKRLSYVDLMLHTVVDFYFRTLPFTPMLYFHLSYVPLYRVRNTVGLENSDPKTSMKITFHAILPLAHWEWDDKSHMHIRFGHDKLGNWEVDCGKFLVARY